MRMLVIASLAAVAVAPIASPALGRSGDRWPRRRAKLWPPMRAVSTDLSLKDASSAPA